MVLVKTLKCPAVGFIMNWDKDEFEPIQAKVNEQRVQKFRLGDFKMIKRKLKETHSAKISFDIFYCCWKFCRNHVTSCLGCLLGVSIFDIQTFWNWIIILFLVKIIFERQLKLFSLQNTESLKKSFAFMFLVPIIFSLSLGT